MDILTITISSIVGAVGGFFLAYLNEKGKNFATKKDIAQITDAQAKVQNQYDAKLATLNGDIQQAISEHDTRYAYLYKLRGEVLDEVYKKMDKIMRLFGASARMGRFNIDDSPEVQQKEASRIFGELFEYYSQNRLYLDPDLCILIEKFFTAVFSIRTDLGVASSPCTFHDLI